MNWVLNKRRPAKAGNYTLCRRRISLNRQRRGRTVGETEEEKKKKESSGHGKEQKGNKWKEVTKPIVSHRLNVGSFLFFLFLNKKMFHSSTSLDTNWWIFRYDGGTCLVKIDNAHKLLLLPLARVFFLSSFFSLSFFFLLSRESWTWNAESGLFWSDDREERSQEMSFHLIRCW